MEQITEQLQKVKNAVSNFNRELLKAQPKLESVTDPEKQAILARLYDDRETVRGIITDATIALNRYAVGLLAGVDKALSNCERTVTR